MKFNVKPVGSLMVDKNHFKSQKSGELSEMIAF